MNKTKRIAFGIGIVLAVLAVLTASAAADNVVYFDPDPSGAAPGNTTVVTLRMNITDGVASLGCDVYFDLDVVNITSGAPGDLPTMWLFSHKGNWVRFGGWSETYLDLPPGDYKLADLTLVANNTGTSALHFDPVWSLLSNQYGHTVPATWNDGTFVCTGPSEDINKTKADIPVSGAVSGSHVDTHESDNVYESIEEVAIATGKPSGRISYLEHKWTIDVISGTKTNVTFHVEANRTDNDEGDDFEFAYWNGTEYVPMVLVNTSEDTNYSCKMPNETSGDVTIRMVDTDRTGQYNDPDTIYIDHMYIRSVLGPPDETPPVITNVTNTAPTPNSATIEWDTDEPADSLVKYGNASGSYTMNEIDATSVTSHSIELTGLESNTTYYYVVNSTDPSGNSNESAEYSFTTETQPSMPDLEITDIWCQFVRKNTYDVYYNIANNGGVEAGRSDSNWTVDGVEEGTDKVASLAPGQTREEKFTYRGSAPSTVKVCADYNSNIDESDETNNCMEKTVTCA